MIDEEEPLEIRILCVDDEPKILEGLERTLGMDHDVTTALSGAEALAIIQDEQEPFALTISDMRMPGMDGATYLAAAAELSPDTIRVLLTGYSETEAAIRAINHGRIFRFLTKPCDADALETTVQDAWRQHCLLTAEKQLLQKTLYSCIKVLTELLSMANPVAFNHGCHIAQLLLVVGESLDLKEVWEVEMAVMLLHLGYVGMTPELLQRSYAGEKLTKQEQGLITGAPGMAHSLLQGIPRIEVVLGMVAAVGVPAACPKKEAGKSPRSRVRWGAHIIQTLERAAQLFPMSGSAEAVAKVLEKEGHYHERVVQAVARAEFPAALQRVSGSVKRDLRPVVKRQASQLKNGMTLAQDAVSPGGVLFIRAGQEITETVSKLLRRMAERDNLIEPLHVRLRE